MDKSSPGTGFRFNAPQNEGPALIKMSNYPGPSVICGNLRRRRQQSLAKVVLPLQDRASGEMAEWLKAHAWKACVRETVPWVRIPLSPPLKSSKVLNGLNYLGVRNVRSPKQSPSAIA